MLRRLLRFALVGFVATTGAFLAPRANAEFLIRIETSSRTVTVNVGDPENTNGDANTVAPDINFVNGELSADGFTFAQNGLSLFSNRDLGGTSALLAFSATVSYNATGNSDGFIRITGLATDYTFPNGVRTFQTSGGPTVSNGAGSETALASYYDASNMGGVTPTGASAVYAVNDPATQAFAFNSGPIPVGNSSSPFAITTISESTLVSGATLQFTNQSTVTATAIPEPASLAMLFLGGSALSIRTLRRRKANA